MSGTKPGGEPDTVQGNLGQARITVLDGSSVDARHLNKHIDYGILPADAATRARSLAMRGTGSFTGAAGAALAFRRDGTLNSTLRPFGLIPRSPPPMPECLSA